MEASWSVLPLGFHCFPRNHRNNSRDRTNLQTLGCVLSRRLWLLPVRLLRLLLDLRHLLGRPVALLPMALGLFSTLLGRRLGLWRPRLLHTTGKIRPRRNHEGPV